MKNERRTGSAEILEAVKTVGATLDEHLQNHLRRDTADNRKLEMILEVTHGVLTDELDVDGNRIRNPSAFSIAAENGFRPPKQKWTVPNKLTLAGIVATLIGAIIASL